MKTLFGYGTLPQFVCFYGGWQNKKHFFKTQNLQDITCKRLTLRTRWVAPPETNARGMACVLDDGNERKNMKYKSRDKNIQISD